MSADVADRGDHPTLACRHRCGRAIERLGARQDGVLRGHMLLGEHRRDTIVYSILEHEWLGVRRTLDALMAAHGEDR